MDNKFFLVFMMTILVSQAIVHDEKFAHRPYRRPSPSPSRRLDVSDLEISAEYFDHQWRYYNKDGVTRISPGNYGHEGRILVQTVNGTDHVMSTTKLITGGQEFFVGIEDDMTCISRMDRKQMACYYFSSDDFDLRIGYDISMGNKFIFPMALLVLPFFVLF